MMIKNLHINTTPLLFSIILVLGWPLTCLALSSTSQPPNINIDRADTYLQALEIIRQGNQQKTQSQLHKHKHHPLYPHLKKAALIKHMPSVTLQEADRYLHTYGNSLSGRQFLYQWLHNLAKQKRWQDFIDYYPPQQSKLTLSCLYANALLHLGYNEAGFQHTEQLWLRGNSLPKNCDKPFRLWQEAGYKSDELHWNRLLLALDANNKQLTRYLIKSAPANLRSNINKLKRIHKNPALLLELPRTETSPNQKYHKDIVSVGVKQLIAKDQQLAISLWPALKQKFALSSNDQFDYRQSMGRQMIADGSDLALKWLTQNDPNGEDTFLLEWRILLAIKNNQWRDASRWINLLPPNVQNQSRWQYWQARSYQQIDLTIKAKQLFTSLAIHKNYYGFMAAKHANLPLVFDSTLKLDSVEIQYLMAVPAIQRAYAFYNLGLLMPARLEWKDALQQSSTEQRIDAGQLAANWGWHQQAIMTTSGHFNRNNYDVRFPLAYKNNIVPTAQSVDIKAEWIYAITRQESAFASDARSVAGAKGLMQLKPSTAKGVANDIGMHFKRSDLFKPDKNVLLGSHYLQQLLSTFNGNHILATAAFNAGPFRVKQWLKRQPQELDFDIWIDTLPYFETRNYIKNVLASSVIYSHKLGHSQPTLIEKHEQHIALIRE